mgnify:FL=1
MELAVKLGIPLENASLMYPSAVIYKCLIDMMEAEHVWIPGVHMTRGIAYEYAEQMKLQKGSHNFENDILMAAKKHRKTVCSKPAARPESGDDGACHV